MDILRLVTIHPILVHGTLGGIPLMLVAYAIAAKKRSALWLFAGDFVLIATALITIGTGIFGFVSFFAIDWPGGLELFTWLHLGLGLTTAGIVWVMAIFRWRGRMHDELPNYSGLVGASAAALLFATLAGWVGGEVLVFRSGVGVIGAQNGALAPPIAQPRHTPSSVEDAMGRIRSHFAAAAGEQIEMIVHRPKSEQFAIVEREARALQDLARWLTAAVTGMDPSIHALASELETSASDLEGAARAKDLVRVSHALDAVESTCISCHVEHRWDREEDLRAER